MTQLIVRNRLDRVVILVYRIPPRIATQVLPPAKAAQHLHGWALGSVVLTHYRDRTLPLLRGKRMGTHWAVHYINTTTSAHQRRGGIFVLRRDTSSRLDTWFDRFPPHCRPHHAVFCDSSQASRIDMRAVSDDRQFRIMMSGRLVPHVAESSVFVNADHAGAVLQEGLVRLGITCPSNCNPARRAGPARGRRRCRLVPISVDRVASSLFDGDGLPNGEAAEFDSAFWTQSLELGWNAQLQVCCNGAPA